MAIRTGIFLGVLHPPEIIEFAEVVSSGAGGVWLTVATLLSVMFTLNLLLFVFNLIPLPPLDGSGVLALLVSDARARQLQILLSRPQFSMLGLMVAWFAIGPIFRPALRWAVNLLYPELSYG